MPSWLTSLGNLHLFGTAPVAAPDPSGTWASAAAYRKAETNWAIMEDEKKKRRQMYREMSQSEGDRLPGGQFGEFKKAPEALTMGRAPVSIMNPGVSFEEMMRKLNVLELA